MADWDPTEAAPNDTQSADASKSGIRQAWEQFSARPENNAALLQFGLAMLQPRAPGQSGIGQFANAVGQGAEAADRNIATQQAQEQQQFLRNEKTSELALKGREAGARELTAQAYADQVKQGGAAKAGLNSTLKAQAEFRKYLAKPEDASGLTTDPIVAAISKQFPDVKSKADLLANPQAMRAAQQLFSAQLATETDGTDDGSAGIPTPPQAASPAPAAGKIVYDKTGKAYRWDGIPGHQPVPIQ